MSLTSRYSDSNPNSIYRAVTKQRTLETFFQTPKRVDMTSFS